jgi:glycosyltransferase involved in cell wall biosynthesis
VSNQNALKNLVQKLNALKGRKFDLIIVPPAPWLETCSKSSTMFKDLPHEVIPHASDENVYRILDKTFCREVFNLPKDKIIFMFASENVTSKRKGFYLLKEALSILNNPDIHLLIVGMSNELIQKELSQLGKDNYSFTNFINDETLLSIAYNAVSAILIPSIEDNLPLTLIDSLLCGVPSVAFNVGGMKDHIVEGINGHKAEDLSGASFAKAINNFILSKDGYDPQKIRAAALKLYAKPVHAAQYISLYKKLVNW